MWKGRFAELEKTFDTFHSSRVAPNESVLQAQVEENRKKGNQWISAPITEQLKAEAKKLGLWNLFLPSASGLTQYEYAQLAEKMGRYPSMVDVFNCDAPDTGNMETLHLYGTQAQKDQYLAPLLEGTIRSAFCMTEPDVASSDASNISCKAVVDGDHYVINGRKWWSSGFGHANCSILIVMVKTSPDHENRHKRQSMILVPANTPGVRKVRALTVFGFDDAPHGHMEVDFTNVRVPLSNVLLGEGRGFEIAQGRLGPGRVHHCMRAIGMAERALELMVLRSVTRTAFGKKIAELGMAQEQIALSRIELDQARLLVLHCAKLIDTKGTKAAAHYIAMIKVVAPRVACTVIDRAIQVHGAAGVSQDSVLWRLYTGQRTLRIADGPDEVHLVTVAKVEIARQVTRMRSKI